MLNPWLDWNQLWLWPGHFPTAAASSVYTNNSVCLFVLCLFLFANHHWRLHWQQVRLAVFPTASIVIERLVLRHGMALTNLAMEARDYIEDRRLVLMLNLGYMSQVFATNSQVLFKFCAPLLRICCNASWLYAHSREHAYFRLMHTAVMHTCQYFTIRMIFKDSLDEQLVSNSLCYDLC